MAVNSVVQTMKQEQLKTLPFVVCRLCGGEVFASTGRSLACVKCCPGKALGSHLISLVKTVEATRQQRVAAVDRHDNRRHPPCTTCGCPVLYVNKKNFDLRCLECDFGRRPEPGSTEHRAEIAKILHVLTIFGLRVLVAEGAKIPAEHEIL